jgi:hypothetical protein
MLAVLSTTQPTHTPPRQHFREGGIHFTPLHAGALGEPGSFTMALVRFDRYITPRHRHNYEQIRVGLKGESPIGRTKVIPEGWVAYHPEGTFYGPQDIDTTVEESPVVLAWQFGGPSFQGFLPGRTLLPAYETLATVGEFRDGTYYWTDEHGMAHTQDGYEAAWSEASGSPLNYPPTRYMEPVLMNPDAFAWFPTAIDGVAERRLGTFDRGLSIYEHRLTSGATLHIDGWVAHRCAYVLSGAVSDGNGALHPTDSAMCFSPNEAVELTGANEARLLFVDLPDLSDKPVSAH